MSSSAGRHSRWPVGQLVTTDSSDDVRIQALAMFSAWRKPHDVEVGACPECQGSCYVPARSFREERIVEKCPECDGTGKDAARKAA